uniref:Late embryogenesis abundant n=1 Tax=Cleistogenes songorica TaxID=121774 RepID=A0A2S1WLX7_9POAL|nr:late embryogenesis abundant [Cleistogenes songorica]
MEPEAAEDASEDETCTESKLRTLASIDPAPTNRHAESLHTRSAPAGENSVGRRWKSPPAEAIATAEAHAVGTDEASPDGLAAQTRAAAEANARAERDEDNARLRDVLTDATARLGADKEVEREDAGRVVAAEVHGTGGRWWLPRNFV